MSIAANRVDRLPRRERTLAVRRLLRSESAMARLGLALIALHVVDDNFVQPQPGTSAADHLVSGLVPLAILFLAAAVYPRLRAGLRAALGLTLGILGLVTASEAFYYSREVGPSGDDYTGFLSIPAGLLLVGVGTVTLWRTRRTDDSLRRRYLRRVLLAVSAILVAVFGLFPISIAYVVTHTARAVVPPADLGAAYEEVAFTTGDGLRLEGWFVPSRNGATVIAFPGRKGPQKHARMLLRHGYGVLLFDRRGEGESQGDPNTFGWAGVEDLHAAVAYLRSRSDVDPGRIGGIGLSVGGEMLIDAA
ncbi:MAG: alpha/beta hydrolase, partial [Gaiellaceae bacterium]